MKYFLLSFLLLTSLTTIAHAQRGLSGPGLGDEQPPTAGLDQQDDNLGKPETMSADETSAHKTRPNVKYNPLNEKGSKGKQAQDAARENKFDMNTEEIHRKQKGQ